MSDTAGCPALLEDAAGCTALLAEAPMPLYIGVC